MRIEYQRPFFVAKDVTNHELFEAVGGWKWRPAQLVWATTSPRNAEMFYEYCTEECRRVGKLAPPPGEPKFDETVELRAPAGLTYRPKQEEGIKALRRYRLSLLADPPRFGKTIQSLGLVNSYPNGSVKRVLIVCGAVLKTTWAREARKWLIDPELNVGVVQGQKPSGNPQTPVLIINWDILRHHEDYLRSVEWDCVFMDESHRVKNPEARRTKIMLGDGRKPGIFGKLHTVFITGTPLFRRVSDLWTTVKCCDPSRLGRSFERFAYRYCDAYRGDWGELKTDGASNLVELQRLMRERFMIRRDPERLFTPVRQTIPIDSATVLGLLEEERDILVRGRDDLDQIIMGQLDADLVAEIVKEYEANQDPLSEAANLGRPYSTVRRELAEQKIPAVVEFTKTVLEEEDKVVVFAHHRQVVVEVAEAFGDAAVALHGGVTAVQKQKNIDRFVEDPTCRVLVANITSASEGLTLAHAHAAIFAEIAPGSGMRQAENRIWLPDKEETVSIYYVVWEGSLDDRLSSMYNEWHQQDDELMNRARLDPNYADTLDADPVRKSDRSTRT